MWRDLIERAVLDVDFYCHFFRRDNKRVEIKMDLTLMPCFSLLLVLSPTHHEKSTNTSAATLRHKLFTVLRENKKK